MSLVRAVHHDLLRRVAERSNQGRKIGGQGAQFLVRRITEGTEKSQQCHKYFSAVHLLPNLGRNYPGAKSLWGR